MAADAQPVSVARIAPELAARALAGLERRDPCGLLSPADIDALCRKGHCYAVTGPASAVYVLSVHSGVVWVDALRGASGAVDVLDAVDAIVTRQAEGARSIGLQTERPGLVRALKQRGYRVAGWILKKDLQ